MNGETFLSGCIAVTLGVLCISMALTTCRLLRGPTLPDRVLALDMLTAIAIGFIAVLGIKTSSGFYVDISIALGLVGFLATVAFARFILARGRREADPDPEWEARRLAEHDQP
ncbi:MAG: cation:proton antiporter [Rhizobiaceae bacterium]|nr:cation:proton antiporter [Rhizobiaceae bacterium]